MYQIYLKKLESNEIQWIWGNFSGIPTKYSKKEILTSKLPGLDNIDKKIITIQHPLAEIEIIAYDSTFVQIITKDENIAKNFKKLYPKSQSTLDEK